MIDAGYYIHTVHYTFIIYALRNFSALWQTTSVSDLPCFGIAFRMVNRPVYDRKFEKRDFAAVAIAMTHGLHGVRSSNCG
jgi:hypothetical protein